MCVRRGRRKGIKLTVDIFLCDILSANKRRQSPHVSFEHALVHREIVGASNNRVLVFIVDGFRGGDAVSVGVDVSLLLMVVAVLRRGFDELVVGEDLVAFAFAVSPGGGAGGGAAAGRCERTGRGFLVRLEQVLVLPRLVVLTEGADLLSCHFANSRRGGKGRSGR